MPAITLLGTDDYRKRQRRTAAIAEFGVPTEEIVWIDSESGTIQALDDALLSLGLFATKKVVVIPEVGELSKAVASRLVTLLPSTSEDTLLILESDKLDQRTELAKAVKKLPTEHFELLQGSTLERWIDDQAKTLGATIESPARRSLIERVGADSWRLHSELEKLAVAALATSPPTITQTHVKELTLATTSPTLFALTDALIAGQAMKARIALAKLVAGGEAPLGILGMLGYHLRTLVLVKDATETRIPAKLHPFVVQKHRLLTQQISWELLATWYERLAEYDAAAKTGTMEPIVALELMVQELSA